MLSDHRANDCFVTQIWVATRRVRKAANGKTWEGTGLFGSQLKIALICPSCMSGTVTVVNYVYLLISCYFMAVYVL